MLIRCCFGSKNMTAQPVAETCCVEDAILQALRGLQCTPVRPENHFLTFKTTENCLPYVLLNVRVQAGLRTTDTIVKNYSVQVLAFFGEQMRAELRQFQDAFVQWLYLPGCLPLGECGCFCVQSRGQADVTYTDGRLRFGVTFVGRYIPEDISGSEES